MTNQKNQKKSHKMREEKHIVGLNKEVDLLIRIDLLSKIPMISKIGYPVIELLAFDSETLTFDSGQVLFSQGEVGNTAYIIMSGEAEVITRGPEGEITIATLGQHQLFGEIAILTDLPRTAMVRAKTELTTLVIAKEMFYNLVTEFPEIGIEIMRELAHRLEQTTIQLRQALSDDTKPIRFSR